MPGGNGTGPMGMGPITGRGAGYCAGNNVPGYAAGAAGFGMGMRRGFGGGFGGGFGRGRGGRGRGFGVNTSVAGGIPQNFAAPVAMNKEQQVAALKSQAQYLESNLQGIKDQLAALEKEEN